MQTRRGFFAALAGALAIVKAIPESIVETTTPLQFHKEAFSYMSAGSKFDRMDLLYGFASVRPDYICSLLVEDQRLTRKERVFDLARLPA